MTVTTGERHGRDQEDQGQYLRIDPALGDASASMDDASEDNLLALKQAGIEAGETHDDELRAFAKLLHDNR